MSVETIMLNSQALKSNRLGDSAERPVQVILPPGYAVSNKRYPVVYYLHGYGMGATPTTPMLSLMQTWWSDYVTMFSQNPKLAAGDFLRAVEQGVQLGKTQEMIIVFPNGSNMLGGTLFLSSPANGDVETYLTKELVEYVDSHYRTLPQRESRGITGCSMGGDGAAQLAFKYPSVYGVAVAQSGLYFVDRDPMLEAGLKEFTREPMSIAELPPLPSTVLNQAAVAAAMAPNEDKPPLYFDMPYEIVDGKARVAPIFLEKARAADARAEVERYLAQPARLTALLVQHGKNDPLTSVEISRDFDRLLTKKGIPHEFDDSFDAHCSYDMMAPMLKFMSDHLAGEEVRK